MKKAQITIFIIISLVLLISVSLFIFQNNSKVNFEDNRINNGNDNAKIENYVKECIEIVLIDAISQEGLKEIFKLETYVESNLLTCLDDFELFKQQGYDITFKKPISKIELNDYLITKQGDVVEVIFEELPLLDKGYIREVGVEAKGYYDRLD
jgi:hypothetical protein